jgi:hypothetical protein
MIRVSFVNTRQSSSFSIRRIYVEARRDFRFSAIRIVFILFVKTSVGVPFFAKAYAGYVESVIRVASVKKIASGAKSARNAKFYLLGSAESIRDHVCTALL